jgi:acyl-CoA thioesterase-1
VILRKLFPIGVLSAFVTACGGGPPTTAPATLSRPLSEVVAFMGDSITAGWTLSAYDSGATINAGVGGQTSVQMLARFQTDVVAKAPGVVVILAGTNDFLHLGAAATNTEILCSVMPSDFIYQSVQDFTQADVRKFNQELIGIALANGYLYADYYEDFLNADGNVDNSLLIDGLHPNSDGYEVMWKVVGPLINEDLQ